LKIVQQNVGGKAKNIIQIMSNNIQIGELIETNEDSYLISVNGEEYFLPINIYSQYELLRKDKIEGVLIYDKRKERKLFEPVHPYYTIENEYDFHIIDFRTYNNKNFIIVKDIYDNEISVNVLKWQNQETLSKKTIKCKVVGLRYGKPILRNIDYNHHIYEVGEEYDFEFVGFEKRVKRNGSSFDVIKLKGEDNCFHEVIPLPSQYGHKFNPKKLRCKVIAITSYLNLTQVKYKDYYYSKIEDILTDSAQTGYFYSLKDRIEFDPNIKELFKQYETESSFWAITLCNKILPESIINSARLFNFEKANFYIDILNSIERWILKSGLLDSLKKEETKQKIKLKSERAIDKFTMMRKAFDCIQKNKINLSDDLNENINVLIYYLRFNKTELIDKQSLVKSIISIIDSIPDNPSEYFNNINYLIQSLDFIKKTIKNDEVELDFIIGRNTPIPFENTDRLLLFLQFTFFQIHLLGKINLIKKQSLYSSEYCKYLTFTTINEFEKINYLKYAFHFSNNNDSPILLENSDLLKLDDITFISKLIIPNEFSFNKNINKDDWLNIVNVYKNKEVINVKLIKKERYGFSFIYNKITGILPVTRIQSPFLKNYPEMDCEIILSVEISNVFSDFNIVLVKEININSEFHILDNLLTSTVKAGDVLKTRVKSIMSYGIFLSSFIGDGLLHKSNITNLYIDVPLDELFNESEECYVCVLSNNDEKIEFGLKQLDKTEYSDTLNRVEDRLMRYGLFTEIENTDNYIVPKNSSLEEDLKRRYFINGHIFEYFSNLQTNYQARIEYLQLSKIYYSAINSERSHFLNIYINYFELLSKIEKTIEVKNIEEISTIVEKANLIHLQMNKNTISLERFPSIYRLIYFLDIVRSFSSLDKVTFDKLYNYIFEDAYKKYPIIQSISKIVLSNNLISSEKVDESVIFKNLNIIYNLLKQGVFNLDESNSEKRARILKERLREIKESIKNEESEKIEFKSSLICPVLNDFDKKRYNKIKKDPTKKNEIENLIGIKAKNRIIHSSVKTLVAFANSKGGTLFIGVDDDGNILGLDNDYGEIGSGNRDEFRKKFDEFIDNYIGNYFFSLISTEIESVDRKEIFIVNVKPADEEVFLLKNDKKQNCCDFYIRRQSSSVKLIDKELINYYKTRYKAQPPTKNIVHLSDSTKNEDDSNKKT
jgi:predicted RNA-binding protein with RPS1 domain